MVGAIDGCHIPIMRPVKLGADDYYNRKKHWSILLQGICDAHGVFWDFFVGVPGRRADIYLFSESPAWEKIKDGALGHYMLIGDAAYPMRTYLCPPFKRVPGQDELTWEQKRFNYCHSVTQLPIEHAFGRLKVRFRHILKINQDRPHRVASHVAAAITLHNILERQGIHIPSEWMEEAEVEASRENQGAYMDFSWKEVHCATATLFEEELQEESERIESARDSSSDVYADVDEEIAEARDTLTQLARMKHASIVEYVLWAKEHPSVVTGAPHPRFFEL